MDTVYTVLTAWVTGKAGNYFLLHLPFHMSYSGVFQMQERFTFNVGNMGLTHLFQNEKWHWFS